MGIPVESGTGGLASYRVIADNDIGPNQGENNPEQLSRSAAAPTVAGSAHSSVPPIGTDRLAAGCPFHGRDVRSRGFTTADNDRIGHLAPIAQFTAVSAAAEVYKALGIEKNVGYHGNDADPHNHCTFYASQERRRATPSRAFSKRSAPPDNFMEPKLKEREQSSRRLVTRNEYIEWTAPTLN